jgi:hypothetical protein
MMEVAINVISLDGGITENTICRAILFTKSWFARPGTALRPTPTNGAYDPQPCYATLTFT